MKIHHIGYLVKKIDKATETFVALGYEIESGPVHDEIRKVDITFLIKDGYRVELVSPYDPDSVVADLIKKYTNMPYHICYESYDYETDVNELKKNAFIQTDAPECAPAIEGKKVAFFVNARIGMIEIIDCGM